MKCGLGSPTFKINVLTPQPIQSCEIESLRDGIHYFDHFFKNTIMQISY